VNAKVSLLFGLVVLAGCGARDNEEPEDRTSALIRCFEQHGGDRVTRVSQLAGFPSADPQYGTGVGLESISFESIDVDAGAGDLRQSLVFVHRPYLAHAESRSHSASVSLRRAKQGDVEDVAMIVMPASVEWDRALSVCAEEVAGDQIHP
jgi:hypothetical protein